MDTKSDRLKKQIIVAHNNLKDPSAKKALMDFEDKYLLTLADSNEPDSYGHSTYSCEEISREGFVQEHIQILAHIVSVSSPFPQDFEVSTTSSMRLSCFTIVVKDKNDTVIPILPLYCDPFFEIITRAFNNKAPILLRGTIFSEILSTKPIKSRYVFYIKSINENVGPLNLICANDYNHEELKQKVEYYNGKHNGIRNFIKETAVSTFGIKGLDKNPFLNKAIDFIILQSFSAGLDDLSKSSNKLHSLVIGPPASGKKFLTQIANMINLVAVELSSTSRKVTQAGLIGTSTMGKDGRKYDPGYLPRASRGILCVQDFHALVDNNSDILDTFAKVMQDGEVIDSTSARTKYPAIVSIHLDMNRKSQLTGDTAMASFKELNIPMHIVSRLDFIMDIPADFDRQSKMASEIIEAGTILRSSESRSSEGYTEQMLKRIVAYALTVYKEAQLDQDVKDYINKKMSDLPLNNPDERGGNSNTASILTRLSRSIQKYLKAIACSNLSTKVTMEDVDEAFDFIDYKIKFVNSIIGNQSEPIAHLNLSKTAKRRTEILNILAGKKAPIKELATVYNETLDVKIDERSFRRAIEEMCAEGTARQVKHGEYAIGPFEGENENIEE